MQRYTAPPRLVPTIRAKKHRRSSKPDHDGESNEKAEESLGGIHQNETPSSPVSDSKSLWGTTMKIYKGLFEVIQANLLPITVVYLLTEGINFLSNRAFHRLTNELANQFLGVPKEMIGNMWWLSQNPNLMGIDAFSGYQQLTGLVFIVAFPISVLIKTVQSTYFYSLFSMGQKIQGPGLVCMFKNSLKLCTELWPRVQTLVPRIISVELIVSAIVIPLQFASLLVFSLPLTLPIIMSVHVALPVAVYEDKRGWEAVARSRQLMKPILWETAIPFVTIIICQRLVEVLQGKFIASLPQRFYYELLEIPIGIVMIGFALSILTSMARLAMPFVCFRFASESMQC